MSVNKPGYVFDLPHGMAVRTQGGVTQIRKPNGVKLTYHNMRFWKGDLIFDGVNSTTKNWGVEKAYGGRLVENLVQSVARDVMAEIMLATDRVPVMSVHDELVWEVECGDPEMIGLVTAPLGSLARMAPKWAPGLPMTAELNVGVRYAK